MTEPELIRMFHAKVGKVAAGAIDAMKQKSMKLDTNLREVIELIQTHGPAPTIAAIASLLYKGIAPSGPAVAFEIEALQPKKSAFRR